MLKLYNTLNRKKQIFKPIENREVKLYACGITAYFFAHIGNLRTYLFEDILRRVLEYNGCQVKHVMNITDVGHLTSDADTGEDKMIKALKREGKELNRKSMFQIANFYTKAFQKDLKHLNIKDPHIWCKATEHIQEQVDMVKKIMENSYAYNTKEAVYFDTLKLKDYGKLAKLDLKGLRAGARTEKRAGKKNPADFALWLKLVGEHKNHIMYWDSPWGKGFPGWHIECSAMSIKYLGKKIDIHCGGIDHIPVHHTNERAQNVAALGEEVVRFWMHGEFLVLKEGRMGKSEGNIIILKNLIEKGFSPLAFRYLCLGAHYRSKLTFSWEALKASENALDNLYQNFLEIKSSKKPSSQEASKSDQKKLYQKKFLDFLNDDLNTPKALALIWEIIKNKKLNAKEKQELLLDFDEVFGLGLKKIKKVKIPKEIKELVQEREKYRKKGNWKKSDEIRKRVKKMGYQIEDTQSGPQIKKL